MNSPRVSAKFPMNHLLRVENLCKIYSLESGDKQGGGAVNSQVLYDVNLAILVENSWPSWDIPVRANPRL